MAFLSIKPNIKNTAAIDHLVERGVEQVLPSKDFLKKLLTSGKRLKIYNGIDPTGPTLHLGHAIVLKKLKEFQDLGHEVVLLVGDFTAQIGDPTDKAATRKPLTKDEVRKNYALYKKQASKFLSFSGRNKARFVFNSKWLNKTNFQKVLELTSLMTVDQMLKRDMFAKRVEEGKPIHLHEFLYPIMQGYDSVILDVDVEIGGNDQLFNMLVGRDFQKKINNKEKLVITAKLLTDATGKKMGKSEGNMTTLLDSHIEMFGKIMSWTDGMIPSAFELCTDVSVDELARIKTQLGSSDINPRDLKVRLAKEIVKFYHGDKKADEAEKNFFDTFSKGVASADAVELVAAAGTALSKIVLDAGVVESMTDFKRLVKDGAVTIVDGEKVSDFNMFVTKSETYKVGKRRFVKISIK